MKNEIASLASSLSLREQVGQMNQHMFGWEAIQRDSSGRLEPSDALKREIDRWGGLGLLYGVFRADPWSGRNWQNGIIPEERLEAAELIQETVKTRGNNGIGVLLVEEAPHGHQALGGAVLPTNLALGSSWNADLVKDAERQIGAELFNSGVHLALVSGLDIARDPRWGRSEECFGEDPYLASLMCSAIVEGMQGESRSLIGNGGVGVVLKHLAAQGEAMGGRNGQSAVIGLHDLHEMHLPMVKTAIQAGVVGFMAAYNDIDGIPCCANPWLLKEYLRKENGFDGIVMADGLAVDRLAPLAGNVQQAGARALMSGVDASLWDEGFTHLDEFGADEEVCQAIQHACERIITLKQCFGLLPKPFQVVEEERYTRNGALEIVEGKKPVNASADPDYAEWLQANKKAQQLSKQLAQECMTLLCNVKEVGDTNRFTLDSVHTILGNASAGDVVVAGRLADDSGCFLGDYTAPLLNPAKSIYSEMALRIGTERIRLARNLEELRNIDWDAVALVVHVVGDTSERSYDSEFASNGAAAGLQSMTASCGEGVDMANVSLPWNQVEMVHAIGTYASSFGIPVATVAVCGRAHAMEEVFKSSSVVLWAGYAGPYGAEAVVRALADDVPIPGRLSVTLPSSPDVVPIHYNDRHSVDQVYKDVPFPILASFGRGKGSLRGSQIELSSIWLDEAAQEMVFHCVVNDNMSSVEPANEGKVSGSFNVYAHIIDGIHVPRESSLVYSRHLYLDVGERREWEARVPMSDILVDEQKSVKYCEEQSANSLENLAGICIKFWAGDCKEADPSVNRNESMIYITQLARRR